MAGELAALVACQDCNEILAAEFPGETQFSRAFILTDIHVRHQPMHPNLVGSSYKRSARREYDEWERLSPYATERNQPNEH